MKNAKDTKFLDKIAYLLRRDSIRATTYAGSGHPTSSLSAADIVAVLLFHVMKYEQDDIDYPNNDRFILSKGHAAPVLYAAYKQLGWLDDDELLSLRDFKSVVEGHPTPRLKGIDVATGSLGMGLSVGIGMALSARLNKLSFKTYVMLGDSEVSEGSVWEAAELGAYNKLANLIGVVDCNGLGQRGEPMDDAEQMAKKFAAFGWHTLIVDGHDIDALLDVFSQAEAVKDQPVMILAKTVKGYGIKSVEGKNGYHGKAFEKENLEKNLLELEQRFGFHEDGETPDIQQPKHEDPACFKDACKQLGSPSYKPGDMVATRQAYGEALLKLGAACKRVVSLDAEVSNSTYADRFAQKYPTHFIESFIAEQNMVGMGMGFAARGFIPFVSTFGAFFTRAYDQIRMAGISRLPLRLVGSHAGVSIGEDGPSQMALEDIAMMRAVPNSVVLYPCDAVSAYQLVGAAYEYEDGISYVRTTRGKTETIYSSHDEFVVGGCQVLKHLRGRALIIAAGITVYEALKAHELLKLDYDIPTSVIDAYSIKPLDRETILEIAADCNGTIITVEDHYLAGGLGEAVAQAVADTSTRVLSLAVNKIPQSGAPEILLSQMQIDAAAIIELVKKLKD